MATYINGDYPSLKYTLGLRIEEIPKKTGRYYIDSCAWLKKNAKRIDVLNLYHLCDRSYWHMLTYKYNNPNGKIYLKLDGWPLKQHGGLVRFLKNLFLSWEMKHSTVISTEFAEHTGKLSQSWSCDVICVPNPFNPHEIRDYRPFSERSNIILTVGRLGTEQKATEILLEAFARISDKIPSWKLKLAGRISGNLNIASDFYAKYPGLKERVIFTGEIRDRNTIAETYRDAKIFAFPSRHEGCPLSLSEALMHGDFAVTSNIPPNRLMTENFRFALASEVDDIDGLAKNLLYACTHQDEAERLAIEGRNAATERCDLKRICGVIADGLK